MTQQMIRALRRRTGLSLRQLARAMQSRWHYNTLWKYEHARLPIPAAYVLKLLVLVRHAPPPIRPCPHCQGTGVLRD